MAWIEWRTGRRGRRVGFIGYRDADGKQRRVSTRSSDPRLVDAHRAHIEAKLEGRADPLQDPGGSPSDVLEAYLAHRKATVAKTTAAYYEHFLRPLVTAMGDMPLAGWTPLAITAHMTAQEGWKHGSQRHFIHAVRHFERWCVQMGVPCAEAGRRIPLPKHQAAEVRPFTAEDIDKIFKAAAAKKHALELPIALAAYAGLSYADLRTLTWDQVDLDGGWIASRRVKTGVAYSVPISAPLREILTRKRALGGPVCRGLSECGSAERKELRVLLEAAGVEEAPKGQRGFHRFRHTFATRLHREGRADLPTLRQAVGHTRDSRMTGRYLTTDETALRAAAERAFG